MVGKIIDNDLITDPFFSETTFYTAKCCHIFGHFFGIETILMGNGNNCQGIQDIMFAISRHDKFSDFLVVEIGGKFRAAGRPRHVFGDIVIVVREAVTVNRYIGCQFLQVFIITVDEDTFGDLIGIALEGVENVVNACEIVRMIKIDIGDDRVFRMVGQEMTLILIRLENKEFRVC